MWKKHIYQTNYNTHTHTRKLTVQGSQKADKGISTSMVVALHFGFLWAATQNQQQITCRHTCHNSTTTQLAWHFLLCLQSQSFHFFHSSHNIMWYWGFNTLSLPIQTPKGGWEAWQKLRSIHYVHYISKSFCKSICSYCKLLLGSIMYFHCHFTGASKFNSTHPKNYNVCTVLIHICIFNSAVIAYYCMCQDIISLAFITVCVTCN